MKMRPSWRFGIALVLLGLMIMMVLNMDRAAQRGKLVETQERLRFISILLQIHFEKYHQYPKTTQIRSLSAILNEQQLAEVRQRMLERYGEKLPEYLKPYLKEMPVQDAWGHDLEYQAWPQANPVHYRLGSPGKDGIWKDSDLSHYQQRIRLSSDSYSINEDIIQSETGLVRGIDFE